MSWLRRHLDVLLFAAGITAMVFLAGMIVGRLGLFPWPALYSAKEAALDLRDNWRHYLGIRSMYELDSRRAEGGVTIHDQALAFDGYTLVAAYRSDHPGRYDAYLLDMDGKIVHQWDTYFRHIWPVEVRPDLQNWDGSVEIHGAYMYPNGDLLVDLGGAGTAKLDRCSKVLWSSERHTHHNVEPMPDGGVITPSKIRREEEAPDERPYVGLGPAGFYDDDTVLLLNPDGSIRHEESVIDILYRSGWQSVLFSRPGTARRFEEEDPIHLNDAEVLTAELASAFPMFKAGDIMLSLRNPNTLMVVDPETWTAKWVMTGPFLGQHDPDFLPNGRILVYDNRITGTSPRFGNSRLIEIDPASKEVVWSFEGTGNQPFYAKARGEQQLLPNGNILISDPHHGRVFEIAPSADNRTVWEWINLVKPGLVGLVTDVQRVPRSIVDWLDRPCPVPPTDEAAPQAKL